MRMILFRDKTLSWTQMRKVSVTHLPLPPRPPRRLVVLASVSRPTTVYHHHTIDQPTQSTLSTSISQHPTINTCTLIISVYFSSSSSPSSSSSSTTTTLTLTGSTLTNSTLTHSPFRPQAHPTPLSPTFPQTRPQRTAQTTSSLSTTLSSSQPDVLHKGAHSLHLPPSSSRGTARPRPSRAPSFLVPTHIYACRPTTSPPSLPVTLSGRGRAHRQRQGYQHHILVDGQLAQARPHGRPLTSYRGIVLWTQLQQQVSCFFVTAEHLSRPFITTAMFCHVMLGTNGGVRDDVMGCKHRIHTLACSADSYADAQRSGHTPFASSSHLGIGPTGSSSK